MDSLMPTALREGTTMPPALKHALDFLNSHPRMGEKLRVLRTHLRGFYFLDLNDPMNGHEWWGIFEPNHMLVAVAIADERTTEDYIFTIAHEFRHVVQFINNPFLMQIAAFDPMGRELVERDADRVGDAARHEWRCHVAQTQAAPSPAPPSGRRCAQG